MTEALKDFYQRRVNNCGYASIICLHEYNDNNDNSLLLYHANKRIAYYFSFASRAETYQIQRSSTFPVPVDPVKEIFLTIGFSHSSLPTEGAFDREEVTTFKTPAGKPA